MAIPFDRLGPWFRLFSASFYPRCARQHVAGLIRTVRPEGLVVDLGGGTGVLLDFAHATRSDLSYVCVDPALGMLEYVSDYAYRVAARGEDLPFGDGVLDALMIGDAIHHFTDLERTVEEARRTLKAGGRLFVFDMNPETLLGRMVAALERRLGEPAHFRTPGQLRELFERHGFSVLAGHGGWRYTLEAQKPAVFRPI